MPRLASLPGGYRGIGGTGAPCPQALGTPPGKAGLPRPGVLAVRLAMALGGAASWSRRLPFNLDAACASAGELARLVAALST